MFARVGALALACTALAGWLGLFLCSTVCYPDELDELYNAVRIAHGAVIYRDFFEFAAPLPMWIAAMVFGLAGPSLFAARLAQLLELVVAGGLLYALGRRLGLPRIEAAMPGLVVGLALFRWFPIYSHHWWALGFLAAGLLGLRAALAGQAARPAVGAGVAIALTALCTQTDGGVGFIGALGTLAVAAATRALPVRVAGRLAGAFLVGFAGPMIVAAGYFVANHAFAQAWGDVLVWPMTHYNVKGGFNDVKLFSDLHVFAPYFARYAGTPLVPALAVALGGLYLAWPLALIAAAHWGWGYLRAAPADRLARLPAGTVHALAVGAILAALMGRCDLVHVAEYDALPVASLALAAGAWRAGRGPGAARELPRVALALFLVSNVVAQLSVAWNFPDRYLVWGLPDGRMAREPAIASLIAHTAPGDRIAALPSGGIFYFFARPPAVNYTTMLPPHWRYNTAAEFEDYWAQVARERPKVVILVSKLALAEAVQDLMPRPPAGYRYVATEPLQLSHQELAAYFFERVDAAPSRTPG